VINRKPKHHRQCSKCSVIFPDQGFSPHFGDKTWPGLDYWARGGNIR